MKSSSAWPPPLGLTPIDWRQIWRLAAREAVLAEAQLGQQQFRVRGTPTMMLADGPKLRHPIAYARMRDERVIGVTPLPCHGDGCIEATRELFEERFATSRLRQLSHERSLRAIELATGREDLHQAVARAARYQHRR